MLLLSQGDEDLVSEFVANEGLGCLLDIGQKCDQSCQQYILKGNCAMCDISSQRNLFFNKLLVYMHAHSGLYLAVRKLCPYNIY